MGQMNQTYYWAKKANNYLSDYPQIKNILRKIFVKWQSSNNSTNIKGANNRINISDSIVKNANFDICGENNTITIDSETIAENLTFYVRGSNHQIHIGKNCRFTRGGTIWIEDEDCNLSIGDNNYIVKADITIVESNSSIEIGNDCMFANDIDIRNSDSHSIINLDDGMRINPAKNIKIEDHVWIGAYSKILKGVTICKDSVVGIGSVVTKSVPNNTVVAGIPAKVVKKNTTWDSQRI